MRRDPDDFGDETLELVHVSRRLKEAQAVESALDEAGEDYAVVAETYRARMLLVVNVERVGAFFYVPLPRAAACRELLRLRGFTVTIPD